MKVRGLDGKNYTIKLTHTSPLLSDKRKRSSYHLQARELLKKLFPCERILEEVELPGSNGLAADFFIPMQKLIVEVHGEQHYQFVAYFHKTDEEFLDSRKRDLRKQEWCDINNLELVVLPYSENTDEWRSRILGR